jgi:hypothetical protein
VGLRCIDDDVAVEEGCIERVDTPRDAKTVCEFRRRELFEDYIDDVVRDGTTNFDIMHMACNWCERAEARTKATLQLESYLGHEGRAENAGVLSRTLEAARQ